MPAGGRRRPRARAAFAIYVILTDEELLIARDTVRLIRGVKQRF